jgi:TonB-dependent starch-binding outer membrane protein SusC
MKKILLTMLCALLFFGTAISQQTNVSGTVISSDDNSSLVGVTVIIKGTTRGTVTDIDGRYTISVSESDTLVFSFIGMQEELVPVRGRNRIDLRMVSAVLSLGELVVTGYSTESSRLVTGSIGVVNTRDIGNAVLPTLDGVLQGRSAGVQITQSSGTPGAAHSIRIRGNSSISAGNQPLIVVDGIPMTTGNFGQVGYSGQTIDALADLNPNDIESLTVLKDASASAIYGARATNGVILITTKRGLKQKTQLRLNATYGMQDIEKLLPMLNAEQWHELKGTTPANPENPINTNWLDEVLRVAPQTNYEITASGGEGNTQFYLSGNYLKQEGVLLGTGYERLSGRTNIDHKISDKLDIGASISVSYALNNRVEGDQSLNAPLANAIANPPIYPVFNTDGSYNEDAPFANPVAISTEAINEAHSYRTLGNIFGSYRIVKNLTFNTKWGYDYLSLREHSYDPATTRQGARSNGIGLEAQSNIVNIVSNNTLRYATSIKNAHNIEVLAGYSFETFKRRNQFTRGVDFPNPYFQYVSEAGTISSATANATDRGMNSWFGQLKYNLNYRYMLSATTRYDGSSRFGEDNRYGFFPAVSVAWRMSEENFFKKIKTPINEFKWRLGYGITGNDGIPDFAYLELFGGGANYGGQPGIYPRGIANPKLKWETTYQFNAGFDMGLFNDRIELTFDYYNNQTKDLLFNRPISLTSGFSTITSNVGELENRGIEIGINTLNLKTGSFEWTSSFNLSRNRNKILSLYNDQPLDNIGRGSNSVRIGEPLGIFYGYKSLGVDPSTGDIVFADMDKNGVINASDRTKIGDPNPDFTGGLNNKLTYKNFEMIVFFQFSYGNDIFNGTRIYVESMKGSDNQTTEVLKRWRQPGDITSVPRATALDPNNNNRISSRFIEDGSYLRLKTISLAYNLDKRLISRIGMSSARVFLTGQNLLTFTQYSGMDPEVNYAGPSDLIIGVDFFTHPQVRVISAGINLGF